MVLGQADRGQPGVIGWPPESLNHSSIKGKDRGEGYSQQQAVGFNSLDGCDLGRMVEGGWINDASFHSLFPCRTISSVIMIDLIRY